MNKTFQIIIKHPHGSSKHWKITDVNISSIALLLSVIYKLQATTYYSPLMKSSEAADKF